MAAYAPIKIQHSGITTYPGTTQNNWIGPSLAAGNVPLPNYTTPLFVDSLQGTDEVAVSSGTLALYEFDFNDYRDTSGNYNYLINGNSAGYIEPQDALTITGAYPMSGAMDLNDKIRNCIGPFSASAYLIINPAPFVGLSKYTAEMYVFVNNTLSGSQVLYWLGNASNNSVGSISKSGSGFKFSFSNSGLTTATNANVYNFNTWYHVAFIMGDSGVSIKVNNVTDGTQSGTFTLNSSALAQIGYTPGIGVAASSVNLAQIRFSNIARSTLPTTDQNVAAGNKTSPFASLQKAIKEYVVGTNDILFVVGGSGTYPNYTIQNTYAGSDIWKPCNIQAKNADMPVISNNPACPQGTYGARLSNRINVPNYNGLAWEWGGGSLNHVVYISQTIGNDSTVQFNDPTHPAKTINRACNFDPVVQGVIILDSAKYSELVGFSAGTFPTASTFFIAAAPGQTPTLIGGLIYDGGSVVPRINVFGLSIVPLDDYYFLNLFAASTNAIAAQISLYDCTVSGFTTQLDTASSGVITGTNCAFYGAISKNTSLTSGLVGNFINCYFSGLVTNQVNGITCLTAYFSSCAFYNQGIVSNIDLAFVNCSISARNKNTVSAASANWGFTTDYSPFYLITPGSQTSSSYMMNIFLKNCFATVADNALGICAAYSYSAVYNLPQFIYIDGCYLYNSAAGPKANSAPINSNGPGNALTGPSFVNNSTIYGFNYGVSKALSTASISNCSFAGCGIAFNSGASSGTNRLSYCAFQANNYDLGAGSGSTIIPISCIYSGATLGTITPSGVPITAIPNFINTQLSNPDFGLAVPSLAVGNSQSFNLGASPSLITMTQNAIGSTLLGLTFSGIKNMGGIFLGSPATINLSTSVFAYNAISDAVSWGVTAYQGASVYNCIFQNSSYQLLLYSNQVCTISNCLFSGSASAGIILNGSNCSVMNCDSVYGGYGILELAPGNVIENCILFGNTICDYSGFEFVTYCCIGTLDPNCAASLDGSCIQLDPLFANVLQSDFHLQSLATGYQWDSPCMGIGIGGADMGAFSMTYGAASTAYALIDFSINDPATGAPWRNPDKVERERVAVKLAEGDTENGAIYSIGATYKKEYTLTWDQSTNDMPLGQTAALETMFESFTNALLVDWGDGRGPVPAYLARKSGFEYTDMTGLYSQNTVPEPVKQLIIREA